MVPSEPDPQGYCQLPVAQVSHGSRDELDAMPVETQGFRDKLEALHITPIETSGSRAELETSHHDIVDTPTFRDELKAPQVTQVDTPSLFHSRCSKLI